MRGLNTKWLYFRTLLASVLAIAALMKTRDTVAILASDGLLSSEWLLYLTIGIESTISIYLLIGSLRATWVAAILTFTALSGVAGYSWLADQSCNCFGSAVSPGLMFAFDVTVLTVTILLQPKEDSGSWLDHRKLFVAMAAGGIISTLGYTATESTDTSDPLKFLLAEPLVGRTWPLGEFKSPELKILERGNWLVVILRRDCSHCEDLVANHFSDPSASREGERTIMFLSGQLQWPYEFDRITLRLGDRESPKSIQWSREPFVASPAVFVLEDGLVKDAADGAETDAFLNSLWSRSP